MLPARILRHADARYVTQPACARFADRLPAYAEALVAGDGGSDRYAPIADHVLECERCRDALTALIDGRPPAAHASSTAPSVDVAALRERALLELLEDGNPLVRAGAARELAAADARSLIALAALERVAVADPDHEVRAAARGPSPWERLRTEWPRSLDDARRLATELRRLAAATRETTRPPHVIGLAGGSTEGEFAVDLRQDPDGPIAGRIERRSNGQWLRLGGLPATLDGAGVRLVLSAALERGHRLAEQTARPGLIAPEERVADGRLEARIAEPAHPLAVAGGALEHAVLIVLE